MSPEDISSVVHSGVDALEVSDLAAGYGDRGVISDIDLQVNVGETVLMVGPNGCGKSTLLKAIAGMVDVYSGTIHLRGRSLLAEPTDVRIRMGLGYLAQERNVFPSLTVRENLVLSRLHQEHEISERDECQIIEAFPFLNKILTRRAGALSGGERQALALSMILQNGKDLYLLDEPSAGLAPRAAANILARVGELRDRRGFSCLIVEHRLKNVCSWVDRAVIVRDGRIVAGVDDPSSLMESGVLDEYYFRTR